MAAFIALAAVPVVAQSQYPFEVFGSNNGESLGTSLLCRGSGVHVGVPGHPRTSFNNVGEVQVYDSSSEALLYTIPFPITPSNDHFFGTSMASLPDSNANNIREIAVGSPGTFLPAVYVFDEGAAGASAPIYTYFGNSGDGYGSSLALVDYPTVDGTPELVIAAPARTPSSGGVGSVDIVDVPTGTVKATIDAPNANYDGFGTSIARIADLDGNGSDDIIIGAPSSFSERGSVLIYSLTGSMIGPPVQLLREIKGDSISDSIGHAVAGIADMNGDGKQDILITTPSVNNGRGYVRLYSGADIASAAPNISPLCQIDGAVDGDQFGSAITGLGDTDKDGLNEFAVGSPGHGGGLGRVSVYQFKSGAGCSVVRSYDGSLATDAFGLHLGADLCSAISPDSLTLSVGTSSDQGGVDAGSAILLASPPTATPTPTPTPTPTVAAPLPTPTPFYPTTADLRFRISDNGDFKIIVTYNSEPNDDCTAILYGRVQVGKQTFPLEKLDSSKKSTSDLTEQTSVVRIINFPAAAKVNGVVPIINMAVRTTCGSTEFDSNVFARYMNCGVRGTEVSIDTWIETLKRAFVRANSQTSVRSDRNTKVVRLKKRRVSKR